MFPHELDRAFEACPAVLLPYGLCEPHEPQNAVGLDALKAPPDYWHAHEVGGCANWAFRGGTRRTAGGLALGGQFQRGGLDGLSAGA